MSWYTIIHVCGHTSERNITGTDVRGERQRKADWFGSSKCPDCWRVDRDTESREAAEQAAAAGWPGLEGSPGQISWAQRLRAETIHELDRICREAATTQVRHDQLRAVLLGQVSASQWIEFRGGSPNKSRAENLLDMRDLMPIGQLLTTWSADSSKGIVETFLESVKK